MNKSGVKTFKCLDICPCEPSHQSRMGFARGLDTEMISWFRDMLVVSPSS